VWNFIVFDDKVGNEFHRERKYVHIIYFSSSIVVIIAGRKTELFVFFFSTLLHLKVWVYQSLRFVYNKYNCYFYKNSKQLMREITEF
jgi:hypothetical protein